MISEKVQIFLPRSVYCYYSTILSINPLHMAIVVVLKMTSIEEYSGLHLLWLS